MELGTQPTTADPVRMGGQKIAPLRFASPRRSRSWSIGARAASLGIVLDGAGGSELEAVPVVRGLVVVYWLSRIVPLDRFDRLGAIDRLNRVRSLDSVDRLRSIVDIRFVGRVPQLGDERRKRRRGPGSSNIGCSKRCDHRASGALPGSCVASVATPLG